MKQTDLEIFRWKWHNDVHMKKKNVKIFDAGWARIVFWKEYAAFTSIMPRQSGKTTMLGQMANILLDDGKQILVFAENKNSFYSKTGISRELIQSEWFSSARMSCQNTLDTHLLVDDFIHIRKSILNELLDKDWASVTMVGSLA